MPRQLMVEYTCDRCNRKWYEGYKEGDEPPQSNCLKVSFTRPTLEPPDDKVEIEYSVLCISCCNTLNNIVDNMDKLEKKSPKPRAKKSAPKSAPVVATPTRPASSVGISLGGNTASLPLSRPR